MKNSEKNIMLKTIREGEKVKKNDMVEKIRAGEIMKKNKW